MKLGYSPKHFVTVLKKSAIMKESKKCPNLFSNIKRIYLERVRIQFGIKSASKWSFNYYKPLGVYVVCLILI